MINFSCQKFEFLLMLVESLFCNLIDLALSLINLDLIIQSKYCQFIDG